MNKRLLLLFFTLFVVMIGFGITLPMLPFFVERLALGVALVAPDLLTLVANRSGLLYGWEEVGGQETVRLIQDSGGDATFTQADASVPEVREALVLKTIKTYGRLDVACNNVGIGGEQSVTAEYSLKDWQRVIGQSLQGPLLHEI